MAESGFRAGRKRAEHCCVLSCAGSAAIAVSLLEETITRSSESTIHGSASCQAEHEDEAWRPAIEDPHQPRGYRELRSPAEMRKLLNGKIVEQDRICAICHFAFTNYNDVVPNHENPKGMTADYPIKRESPSVIMRAATTCQGSCFSLCRDRFFATPAFHLPEWSRARRARSSVRDAGSA